jgi:PAS domain-containing protein
VPKEKELWEFARNVLEAIHEPLVVLDADLQVVMANRSFYQTFKVARACSNIKKANF